MALATRTREAETDKMPLIKPRKGATKKQKRKIASDNIATERRAGKPIKEAIAIGLNSAGLGRKKTRKPRKPLRKQRR
jgi:hypothetical protein